MSRTRLLLSLVVCLIPATVFAETPAFQPDARSVQRFQRGYRYPQAGWIVLHIEGEPYERGYQHGRLLAPEIAAHLRCFAAVQSAKAPEEGWKLTRTLVNSLFLRRFHPEYLEEMKGIAEGAAAAGAKFDKRSVDLLDIVALNCWAEVESLDAALDALPTGLEGKRFPRAKPKPMPAAKPMHCSAFAATGPATADGKIVFGHITMFSLYPSNFYNVWLDLKPAKGHRVLMQTYPGGIQSGMDYYFNDAGLLVCETTIDQTRFDVAGRPVATRVRQALQYADSIDGAVEILRKENNGLYTNEWLLGDTKTNEIAMFELGTHKSKLWRGSKNEWFGGTPGFYWGCNNTKDLDVRLETVASPQDRPENLVWKPSDRDQMWQQLYAEHKGKIDLAFARKAFTTPPVAAFHSLDAKFTTTDLAKGLKTWGQFGPPLGRTWQPTHEERQQYPEIKPLVSNPWTVLEPLTPPRPDLNQQAAVDLPAPVERPGEMMDHDELPARTTPVWQGTILPKTDADAWLAAAFADYERYVAREYALRDQRREDTGSDALSSAERERLAVELFAQRGNYLAAARVIGDVPLAKTRSERGRAEWYRLAAGKGFLLLHELRRLLGDPRFEETMDTFGRANAGKPVSTADFRKHCEAAAPQAGVGTFLDSWLLEPGLPSLSLHNVALNPINSGDVIQGKIQCKGPLLAGLLEVTLRTHKDDVSERLNLGTGSAAFQLQTLHQPKCVIVDRYGELAKANGAIYSVRSFRAELSKTLIVYGTKEEMTANREAAEALQTAIREAGSNLTVPLKADTETTEADLAAHHLLLIGRPDSNALVERWRAKLPLAFGSRSFVVRDEAYAHAESGVFVAFENPANPRYSAVVVAGLSAAATARLAPRLMQGQLAAAEVVVLPHAQPPRALMLPARELVHEFNRGG